MQPKTKMTPAEARLKHEIERVGADIDERLAERVRNGGARAMKPVKPAKLGRKPKLTVDEMRAVHVRLAKSAHNPYDAHHDAITSTIAKLDAYFKGVR